MARIYKYTVGALVLIIVIASAILMADVAGLLGGALVLLVALIAVLLVVRARVNRDERSAQADWSHVLDDRPGDGSDFTNWVPTPARGGRVTPASEDELASPPEPRPAPPLTDDTASPSDRPQVEVPPVDSGWVFPFDEVQAETTAFPGHDDFPDAGGFPSADFLELEPRRVNGHDTSNGHSGSNGNTPQPSVFEPVPAPLDHDPTDALAYVGAAAAAGGQRRSIIDWSGPVRTVEAQVRTNEDILEASAATALPTGGDRPAPAAGSELARLLAKVEARLRDYE